MSGSDSEGSEMFEKPTFQKFWSAVVVPGEDYSVEPPLDLVLTRVVLASDATSTDRTVLTVSTPEDDPITIAHLALNRKEQTNVNLVFSSEEEVTFSVQGKNRVHLSGYYELPENFNEDFDSEDEGLESDEEGEHVHGEDCLHEEPAAAAPANNKRKSQAVETPVETTQQKKAKKEAPKKEATPEKPKAATKAAATPAKTPETKTKPAEKKTPDTSAVTKLPNGLIIEELALGNGPVTQSGKKVGVKYAGFLKNGTKFDSSLDKPFTFKFGAGQVIQGWDLGLKGMKVGGKRKLTIPAKLAYGKQGTGPIPPNADLIFNVELCSVKN